MTSTALAEEIVRCPELLRCKEGAIGHACSTVVEVQSAVPLGQHQVPEPWVGHIESAPILFVSSNPSIDEDAEHAARWSWTTDELVEYFEGRFSERGDAPGGIRLRKPDGSPGQVVRFWVAVRARAAELLQREAVPGSDYALSEVVHCKSRSEIGVAEASAVCPARYLRRVLDVSGARVIVVLGRVAAAAVRNELGLDLLDRPVDWHGRAMVALPHPNARQTRTFAACLQLADIDHLRRKIADADDTPSI